MRVNILKSLMGSSGRVLSAAEAKARIDSDPSLIILDVRQPDEFRSGHLKNAKLIPLGELKQRMSELPNDRDILCVCHSGSRSGSAVQQLNSAGFKAINLQGGMIRWQMAGFPVQKGR